MSNLVIEDSASFRSNLKNALLKLIGNENIASNLEKGVYNYSLEYAHKMNVVKQWSNQYFVQIYADRLRSIFLNLKKNADLLKKLQDKEIKAHRLAYMTHLSLIHI